MQKTPTASESNVDSSLYETVSRQSGGCTTSSVRSENLPLSREQQQIAAAYWPLSRKAANTLKQRLKKRRPLSTEEQDEVDDYMTEALFALCRKVELGDTNKISGFLSVSFKLLIKWYRFNSAVKTEPLTKANQALLEAPPEWYDIVTEIDCPHADIVRAILSGESLTQTLTYPERKKWYNKQREEVQLFLKELYELD